MSCCSRADLPVGRVQLLPRGVPHHGVGYSWHSLESQLYSPEAPSCKGCGLSILFCNVVLTGIVLLSYNLLHLRGVEPLDWPRPHGSKSPQTRTRTPSPNPTRTPTSAPSPNPTRAPTYTPTNTPTTYPTVYPTTGLQRYIPRKNRL